MSKEVDEFLNGVQGEQDNDPFKPESNDPFTDNSSQKEEVKKEEEKEEDVKPLPFHKDPKVLKFIEKEVNKKLEGVKPTETERFKEETGNEDDDITDVLTTIIGNDTPERVKAVKDFKKILLEREDKGAEKALKYFQEQQQKEQQVYKDAENEVEQGFESIEERFGIDLDAPQSSKLRNDFIDFVTKISPKDTEGNIVQYADFEASFETFQEMNKRTAPSNSKAKELASKSIARANDASSVPVTGDKSWKAVEKLFGRLG